MADTGWRNFTAFWNIPYLSCIDWANPSNAQLDDTNYAGSVVNTNRGYYRTDVFACSGLSGDPIPTNATITGIEARLLAYSNPASETDYVTETNFGLQLNSNLTGNTKDSGIRWDSLATMSYRNFGGSSDTWGIILLPSQANGAFGIQFYASGTFDTVTAIYCYVDHIQIKIYYHVSEAAAEAPQYNALFFAGD